MTLFEQQSTLNYNMPLRGFMYFSQLFDKYLVQNGLNIYQRAQIKIPTPQFYVLYNGTENCEDRVVLRLSDAFQQEVEPRTFEWTAIMVNINYGYNQALMDRCRPLKEYAVFVGRIRDYAPEMGLDEAVDRAVSECISEGILSDFLATHKSVMDAIAKENKAEGRNITIYELVHDGELSPEKGAKRLSVTVDELKRRMSLCGYTFPID